MITVIEFKPEHLLVIDIQERQKLIKQYATSAYGKLLKSAGPCYTVITEDGTVVGCGGLAKQWEGRYLLWSILARQCAGSIFFKVNRIVSRFLAIHSAEIQRIEVTVDADFPQARRWVESLGFNCEGLMKKFNPDGSDAYLFAKVT